MKAAKEHRVPLSAAALAILEDMAAVRMGEFVFPGSRSGRALSDTALRAAIQTAGSDTTVHGFRSSFRDWAGNETNFPREIAEQALAHAIGNAVEVAYRREDALEKRRLLMQSWADFCARLAGTGDVIPLRQRAEIGT
jgi:integrase